MDIHYRDTWYWAMVLLLIREYDFQIVESPIREQELLFRGDEYKILPNVLLLRNRGRKFELIRLQAIDYTWGSMLARDRRRFADYVPTFRKRLKAASLTVHSIYFYSYSKKEHPFESVDGLEKIDDPKSNLYIQELFLQKDVNNQTMGVDELNVTKTLLEDNMAFLSKARVITESMVIDEMKQNIRSVEQEKERQFKKVFEFGKPILTYLFLFINVIMFLLLEWFGSSTNEQTLILFGAKWTPGIVEGEYWRLITPMFLHIGILHLTLNSLALYFLGNVVEKVYGSLRFFGIYMFAGFAGTLASFAFTPYLAAGASGAIFGCFGALLYFGLKQRNLFFRTIGNDIIFIVMLNLVIGFVVPIIDNFGHIGGLIGGFLASMLFQLPRQSLTKERLIALLIMLFAVGTLLWMGLT
jgi:rhomboid protease GluP